MRNHAVRHQRSDSHIIFVNCQEQGWEQRITPSAVSSFPMAVYFHKFKDIKDFFVAPGSHPPGATD